jgi:ankyrin repeat protein
MVKHRGSRKGKKRCVRRTRRNRRIRGGNVPKEPIKVIEKPTQVFDLITAIRTIDKQKVENILNENSNTAKGVEYNGSRYLPLLEAVIKADTVNSDPKREDIMEIIEKLINAGADPNKANVYGSPLLLAITSDNRELVNFLIEKSPKLVLDAESKHYINSLPEDYEYKQFLKTRFKDMF